MGGDRFYHIIIPVQHGVYTRDRTYGYGYEHHQMAFLLH